MINKTDQRVYSLMGIAMKARKVVSGELQTMEAIKTGQAFLVIVARDASDNTRKVYKDKCTFYEIAVYEFGTMEMLGHAIGRDERAAVGICDEGLAESIERYLKDLETEDRHGEN